MRLVGGPNWKVVGVAEGAESPASVAGAAGDAGEGRAFAAAGRRDRSKSGRRPLTVQVRVSEEERSELAEQAAAQGVSIQRYLLECAAAVRSGGIPVETASARQEWIASVLGLRRLLATVANNVNQVAKVANAGGLPMAQREAVATFQAARRASDRLYDLADEVLEKR